jgi:hypothetical protein
MGVSGQRHALAPFYPREGPPVPIGTGGWVGSRAALDTEVGGKTLFVYRGSNLDRPLVQSVVSHYTD